MQKKYLLTPKGYTTLESEYHPSYRNNDRVMVEDASLVEFVWNRIKDHVPAKVENSTTTNRNWQGTWEVIGLNERFRFCRYYILVGDLSKANTDTFMVDISVHTEMLSLEEVIAKDQYILL